MIPFKATVSKMVDHFESRANDLTESELRLAGRVLQVCSVLFWGFGGRACVYSLYTQCLVWGGGGARGRVYSIHTQCVFRGGGRARACVTLFHNNRGQPTNQPPTHPANTTTHQIEDILEEVHPDESLLQLLQSEEGGVGLERYKSSAEALLHDPREWDTSALEGRDDELFDREWLAAKYDRIMKHYGFQISEQDGRGMGLDGEDGGSKGGKGKQQLGGRGKGGGVGELPGVSAAPSAWGFGGGAGGGGGEE